MVKNEQVEEIKARMEAIRGELLICRSRNRAVQKEITEISHRARMAIINSIDRGGSFPGDMTIYDLAQETLMQDERWVALTAEGDELITRDERLNSEYDAHYLDWFNLSYPNQSGYAALPRVAPRGGIT